MPRAPSGEWETLQLERVWVGVNPMGVALILQSSTHGTLALPIDQAGIDALRKNLADAEIGLGQDGGSA